MCSALPGPHEFFLDRNLGRGVTEGLRAAGWVVHHMRELYPDDGQDVADEVWLEEMGARGWGLLTKDARIRYRAEELAALNGQLFCLAGGQLRIDEQVQRFVAAAPSITRVMEAGDRGFWFVYGEGRIVRKWP